MEKKFEKRICKRFSIHGANLSYKRERFLLSENFSDVPYSIVNISRGGVKFQCSKNVKIKTKITVKIYIPEEDNPIVLKGIVRWVGENYGSSDSYRIGVQFNIYRYKKNQNNPEYF